MFGLDPDSDIFATKYSMPSPAAATNEVSKPLLTLFCPTG